MIQKNPESYCWNPDCLEPQFASETLRCQNCGSNLLLDDRYQAIQLLGQGTSGKTFVAHDRSSEPPVTVVVKQVKLDNLAGQSPEKLQRLEEVGQHSQLPRLIQSFLSNSYHYIVQEYIAGENLANILAKNKKLSSVEVGRVLASLLPVLQWLHQHHLIHTDIKPENIIHRSLQKFLVGLASELTQDLVLVDLGSAQLDQTTATTAIGSPEYAAPEQMKGYATFSSDLYSLGVTCIHLLTGVPPFSLLDIADNDWVWRNYWLPEAANAQERWEQEQLAQLLDQLIAVKIQQRCPAAAAAIAQLQQFQDCKPIATHTTPIKTTPCQVVLRGHEGLFANVNAIAFSPDGQILISASDDKTLRVWDVRTGQTLQILSGHTQFVRAVAFHPQNPNWAVSGSRDRSLKRWDLQQQTELQTLIGHDQAVQAVCFNPTGEIIISGSADKTVKLWDATTGALLQGFRGHSLGINTIACHPSQPILASGSSDCTIRLWNWQTLQELGTLRGHTAAVKAVVFSPDGQCLVTGGADRSIQIWNLNSQSCARVLPGHSWDITALAFSANGEILISGSWDKTLKLWQFSSGAELEVLSGHTDSISCVAIAPHTAWIASGSYDKTIRLWRGQNQGNS